MIKYLGLAIVLVGHAVPLFTRIDIWPLSDYRMFSERKTIAETNALEVFHESASGKKELLLLNSTKFGYASLHSALATHDPDQIRKAVLMNLRSEASHLAADDKIVLYRVGATRLNDGRISQNDIEILRFDP